MYTAVCADGEIRLVGGSTDREGRVEVCVGSPPTLWRTVCTGSQELAGAICSQMGYIFEGNRVDDKCELYNPPTESTVANSFPPGAFPEYGLDCTQLSNGTWHCSPVEQQCVGLIVELGVVCISYEEYYERSKDRTLSTQLPPIECNFGIERGTTHTGNSTTMANIVDNSTTFIVGIGVVVALLLAVSVGWIVSCVILLKRGQTVHKQQ